MKLSKVIVKNLFGTFNHEVGIKNELGITIIIGENGLGKTALLELIDGFFNGKFNYVKAIAFDVLIFEFSDQVKWVITKLEKDIKEDIDDNLVLTQVVNREEDTILLNCLFYNNIDARETARIIANKIPFLRRIAPVAWEDVRNRHIYRVNDILNKFGNNITYNVIENNNEYPEWFKDRFEKINVNLIKTQRLLHIDDLEERPMHTVEKYSAELSRLINNKLTESTELSRSEERRVGEECR